MQKKILTSHFLEDHLKKGWCLDDFTQHFGVDETGFNRMLGRVTKNSTYVNNYKSRLLANEKRRKKCHDYSKDNVTAEMDFEDRRTTNIAQYDEFCESENLEDDELLQLQQEELTLIQSIERNTESNKMLAGQEAYMKSEIEQLRKKLEQASKSLNEICEKISQNDSSIESDKEKLENVREQIKQLTKITVFAYSDCEVEIVGDEKIPDNWTKVFDNLIHNDNNDCIGECTVNQVKQFAKVISIANTYSDRVIDVNWEFSMMQEVFEKIK